MRQPMNGVRVVEVAMYGFVTSAGAVLADWGADVLKVEHATTGDPQRGLKRTGSFVVEGDLNPNIEHPNRGKRSIGLDIGTPQGRAVLYDLAKQADVFLTSLLPPARAKFEIDVEHIRAVNPNIIYARGSALGARGEEASRGGYDMTAFWCRAGTAASITPPDLDGMIPPPAPAYGDTISGTNLAGGIAAALFARERTGEASVVDVSLLGSGLWSMGMGIASSLLAQRAWVAPKTGAAGSNNPLTCLYKTADDRYISLVMLQAARYWADVCRHVDRPELADDPRFATQEDIDANAAVATEELRQAIGAQPLSFWTARFATLSGPWAPVQDTLQIAQDAQIRGNDYIATVTDVDGNEYNLVVNPVQFDGHAAQLTRAPLFAEHTDAVLEDLGYDWDRVVALKVEGVVT
ncbi:MAG TPA: CoA transferase [Acidimicrobiales bacterium]|nr:CoA transferase [Acidimicrobiales bacterium]